MRNLAKTIGHLLHVDSEKGVTAIEYGLLATLIALAIIVAVTAVGTALNTTFNNIATQLADAGDSFATVLAWCAT